MIEVEKKAKERKKRSKLINTSTLDRFERYIVPGTRYIQNYVHLLFRRLNLVRGRKRKNGQRSQYLRGTIVIRTCYQHKTPYIFTNHI